MSGQKNNGVKHVSLEGGIIHAVVRDMGYITKERTDGHDIFDYPT